MFRAPPRAVMEKNSYTCHHFGYTLLIRSDGGRYYNKNITKSSFWVNAIKWWCLKDLIWFSLRESVEGLVSIYMCNGMVLYFYKALLYSAVDHWLVLISLWIFCLRPHAVFETIKCCLNNLVKKNKKTIKIMQFHFRNWYPNIFSQKAN